MPRHKRVERPPNPWRRDPSALRTNPEPDLAGGEPHLADLVRHEIPATSEIKKWVVKNAQALAKFGVHGDPVILTKAIKNVALYYRQGQAMEDQLAAQSKLKRTLNRRKFEGPAAAKVLGTARGEPNLHGDRSLIWKTSQFLELVRNRPVRWAHYRQPSLADPDIDKMDPDFELKGKWEVSELQRLTELFLSFFDPLRKDPPKSSYYPNVKVKRGLRVRKK